MISTSFCTPLVFVMQLFYAMVVVGIPIISDGGLEKSGSSSSMDSFVSALSRSSSFDSLSPKKQPTPTKWFEWTGWKATLAAKVAKSVPVDAVPVGVAPVPSKSYISSLNLWWNDAATTTKDIKDSLYKHGNKDAIQKYAKIAKFAIIGTAAIATAKGLYDLYSGLRKSEMEKTLEPLAKKLELGDLDMHQ